MNIVLAIRDFATSRAGRASSIGVVLALAIAVAGVVAYHGSHSSTASGNTAERAAVVDSTRSHASEATLGDMDSIVSLSRQKRESFGIETAPVRCGSWQRRVRVTGRIELNESRVAHINSPVEGIVRDVCVELGDSVQVGDVITYIDSREVGEAKLKLVRDRLSSQSAQKTYDWHKTIHDNTVALLAVLRDGATAREIEEQFQQRPIGSFREQLVTALVQQERATADYQRVRSLGQNAVIPEKQVIRAKAESESAEAAYRAIVEQIRFDAQQQVMLAQQRLHEAEMAVAISRSQLLILGYKADEINAMDPIAEGERVACYPVRAPLSGTVIARPALLSRQVDAKSELVEIADLSTIWLRADIFEKDLGAVNALEGNCITFRTTSYPGREFTAKVFTAGHLVDDETRAARLLATVDNRERLLKPGMFVKIEITAGEDHEVLQVGSSAIQRHDGATFVFVQRRDGHFERRDVRVGRSTAEIVEVTDGLSQDELVVVNGGFALKSNMLSKLMVED